MMADESSKFFSSVDADTCTSGSPSSSQQPDSTTEKAGPKPSISTRYTSKESSGLAGSKSSPGETPRITKTTTERSATTCSQQYKSELVSPKVATPDETMDDIDGSNSTSSSHQNKNTQFHKQRGSTDLLLIAAAQREASDSTKPAANSEHSKTIIEKKVSLSPTKKQQKQPPLTKASGRNKGTPQPHVYHDYSAVPDTVGYTRKKTGGVSTPFPEKLMEMLSRESLTNSSIVSWLPHGRAFIVRKPKEFSEHIMHTYFRQTKITSFQRQLNLYGFRRLTQGPDAGAYYHEMFLRGRMQLAARMTRQKVKGIGHKQPSHRESEPNLYALPHLPEDSPSEEATIPPSKEDNTSGHVGNNRAHMSLACLHQTPATATKYCQPSTIAAAAARNVTAGLVTSTSPPLVSPAIEAAKLLKSMATAKVGVTPGSFPSMLTWALTSNSSSSSPGRGDASSKHEAATPLLPPPPPLHTEKSSTGRSTGARRDRGHLPDNGQEELIKAASRGSTCTDATNRSSSSKMNVDNDDDEDANNVLPPMTSMPSQ